MFTINTRNLAPEIQNGINELKNILDIETDKNGITISTVRTQKGFRIQRSGTHCTIFYSKPVELYRALGMLKENESKDSFEIAQDARFDKLSMMLDCSRNAVLNTDTVKKIIRISALMGFDTIMLYTEDVYEVEGNPYFGHMRGRYTKAEIRKLDQYAQIFGIELMPCIQALAHLNSIFRWPVYQGVNDCNDILLADDEKTYTLLEQMIASISEMYTSRNINIGMDEAALLGFGNYIHKKGYSPQTEIFTRHCVRVLAICKKYGFNVSMWSDMFFHSEFGNYYDSKGSFSEKTLKLVPKDVNLIYWDYYHEGENYYEGRIEKHYELSDKIHFAGGAWKWTGFAPYNKWSFNTSLPALEACIAKRIRNVAVTLWSDNGGECSVFSVLPVLALYSEACYSNNLSESNLSKRLRTCANCSFEDFFELDIINELYEKKEELKVNNSSKYLFYNDPLLGLYDKNVVPGVFNEYFRTIRKTLQTAGKRTDEWNYIFQTLEALSHVLELKCDFGIYLKDAYDRHDLDMLKRIETHEIDVLLKRIDTFYRKFRRQWHIENKTIGFDVQDIRIGGLIMRMKSLKMTLHNYLSGDITKIEELEQERLPFNPENTEKEQINLLINTWSSVCTSNVIG